MSPELNMIRMEVPTAQSLDAKYCLETTERKHKRSNHRISPVDNACNVASCLIKVEVVIYKVIVLDCHGVSRAGREVEGLGELRLALMIGV